MPKPKDCPPTTGEIPVVVNVNKTADTPRRKNSVQVGALVAGVAVVFTAVGFLATYVFATKTELAVHDKEHSEKVADIKDAFAELKGDVRVIREQITAGAERQKVYQEVTEKRQEVIDENLRRLMRRSGVRAARRINTETDP